MVIHTIFQGGFFILFHCVCCHCNDRDVFCILPREGTDGSGRFIAVHDGHLHIHENCIVIVRFGLANHCDCICTIRGTLYRETGFLQYGFGDFTVQLVVFHQKDTPSAEVSLCPGTCLFLFDQVVGNQ